MNKQVDSNDDASEREGPATFHPPLVASGIDATTLLATVQLHLEPVQEPIESDALLAEIHGKLSSEKFAAMIDACQQECLQAVIRPFGVGRLLFEDKLGGNVDTIHNVRNTDKRFNSGNGVYATKEEEKTFNSKKSYSYYEYHDGNKKFRAAKKNAAIGFDVDHPVSCSSIHNDPGLWLAGLNGPDVANIPENHQPLGSVDNRAKGADTARGYLMRLSGLVERRKKAIETLESLERNGAIGEKQKIALELLRNNPALDEDALIKNEEAARSAIDSKINRTYYSGKKFITRTATTCASEGMRMGLQQAAGLLMEEFVRATFVEIKDCWRNGFKTKVDDSFLAALKERLMRIAIRIQSRWRDSLAAFKDGLIGGFFSNLITVIINTFRTTLGQQGRMIREGVVSLYRALKLLASPPEDMTLAEAADAAVKLLAGGLATTAGIAVDAALSQSANTLFGPLGPYIVSACVGLVTGLGTAFVVYLLDQIDLFGVQAKRSHEQAMTKLCEMIDISYEQTLDAASVFGPPALLHLT